MKRLLFTIIYACFFSFVNAQIAKWLIDPSYESIRMANGIDAIITDSLGTKVLWTYEGKRLAEITSDISEFREDLSVTIEPESANIASILKNNGEIINIKNCKVAHSFPYFSCGKLLVLQGRNYRFIGKNGNMGVEIYEKAYPFFNGYASCQTLSNGKQKESHLLLIDKNENVVQFSYNGKNVKNEDINFISSVNDENIAIVVIKHKLYYFNGRDASLSPVFSSADITDIKNQAKIDKDFSKCYYANIGTQPTTLIAKCGKNTTISFEFDRMLRPIAISANGTRKKYDVKVTKRKDFDSPLKGISDGNLYGIYWKGLQVLPPQFDEVLTCFGNKAFVKRNGKYGMLEVDKDDRFSLRINKGNDIAFLHQKYETIIRVDMPTYILSDKTYIEVAPDCGIELDKTSREKKNTESGNFIEYNCVLTIPENLPDEIEEVTYPVQILYNGLRSPIINHKVNAWFYKKFEVEEDDSQRSVEQGTLTIVFNIKNAQIDGSIVKFDVTVSADTLEVQREDKMSESRYKYKVFNLNEGINNVTVQVHEQGCPPASFPFEVEYHRPVDESKTTSPETEKVVIKKRPIEKKQQTTTPRLEI